MILANKRRNEKPRQCRAQRRSGSRLKTAQSEQAFSDDGGKTLETNWVNKYTRLAP